MCRTIQLQTFHIFITNAYEIALYTADGGYTPSQIRLTAVQHAIGGTPDHAFSRNLRRASCKVEMLFGLWKVVWRIRHKERSMHYEPDCTAQITQACAILHNFLRREGYSCRAIYWQIEKNYYIITIEVF